jgi:hypothetical protein
MNHFITYGDENFVKSKERIVKEAKEFGFDTIHAYGPDDMTNEFKTRFSYILKHEKLGGYELWKPYFLKKRLDEINMGDILVYADSGSTINLRGKGRFNQYVEMLNKTNTGFVSFIMPPYLEKDWATKEIFDYFNVTNEKIKNSGQLHATVFIIKKCPNSLNIINDYFKTVYNYPELFTDCFNQKQASYFRDNRHGQSILSILRKKHGTVILYDEAWFPKYGEGESLKYPFWGTRIKG